MKNTHMKHKAGRGGWSTWVKPAKGFLFKCCDCGLVHELEFKTIFRARRVKK